MRNFSAFNTKVGFRVSRRTALIGQESRRIRTQRERSIIHSRNPMNATPCCHKRFPASKSSIGDREPKYLGHHSTTIRRRKLIPLGQKISARLCYCLLCALLLVPLGWSEQFSFPNFDDLYSGVAAGFGVNPNAADPRDLLRATAITFTTSPVPSNPGKFSFNVTRVNQTSDVFSSRSASAEIEGRYLMYQGKASFEINTASRKTSDSVMWTLTADKEYGVREQLTGVQLTPVASARLKNDGYDAFVRQFGTHFVSSYSRMAHLAIVFEAYSLTQEDEQYVNVMIEASAQFAAGDASAQAKMSSAFHSLSTYAKTRVSFQGDGINTDKYFAGMTDLTALDQIQKGVTKLLGDFDNQQGNVAQYYTSAYADVIPNFPLPEPVVVLSEQQKAQAAFEQAYVVKLQIDHFRKGPRGPNLDAKEASYLDSKTAECDNRLANIDRWLKAFKSDTTLKAREWPAIQVRLPELIYYAAQPFNFRDGKFYSPFMTVFISGGSEVGGVNWYGTGNVNGQHREQYLDQSSHWPSKNDIQPLDSMEKLDQARDENGALRRWFISDYDQIDWNTFQGNIGNFYGYLVDKGGKVIEYAKDQYGHVVPQLKIALGQDPWPGPTGDLFNKDWAPVAGLLSRSIVFLRLSKPIDNATFTSPKQIDWEAISGPSAPAQVEFLMDDTKLPAGTVTGAAVNGVTYYRYSLVNPPPGEHQLNIRPAGNAKVDVIEAPITFTVNVRPTSPVITLQPQSATVNAGGSVNLNVTATGTPRMSYVWQRNGEEIFDNARIRGSATSVLSISSAADSDNGSYTVVASNSAGTVASNPAMIKVGSIPPPIVTINVSAFPTSGGTVTGGGVLNQGNNVTVVATPAVGYTFSSWSEVGALVSSSASYTFTASANRSLVASFTPIVTQVFTITVVPSHSGGGTVTGGGSYNNGRSVTVVATPGAGSTFSNWTENGTVVSSSASYPFIVSGNRSLVANFIDSGAPSAFFGTQVSSGFVPGGKSTISCTLAFPGQPSALGWSVVIPPGWSYDSGQNEPGVHPSSGDSGTLAWAWSSIPTSPIQFSYTLRVPSGESGQKSISGTASKREAGKSQQVAVTPDPLVLNLSSAFHSADTDHDWKISLPELLRVIELFNYRSGTARTGDYHVEVGTDDGFGLGSGSRSGGNHSADSDHDWKLSLQELLRVIELYNYRSGTKRTGEYHAQSGSDDGYELGPAPGLAQTAATHSNIALASLNGGSVVQTANRTTYSASGNNITVQCQVSFIGTLSTLGWQATIPEGWGYVSGASEPDVKPSSNETGTLNWAWISVPASPIQFSYTLRIPSGQSGQKVVEGKALYRVNGRSSEFSATPLTFMSDEVVSTPPVIATQPQSQSITAGANVTISVGALGAATLSYQWQFNGNPIAGATSSMLSLNNADVSNAGSYTVVVSNSAGSVTSSPATLIVTPNSTPPPQSGSGGVKFVAEDRVTRGNWRGKFGADGYVIIGEANKDPSYAETRKPDVVSYVWSQDPEDDRALQRENGIGRIAACWVASKSFSIDLNLRDDTTHQVTLYFLDWDSSVRVVKADVIDKSGTVVDSRIVSSYHNGNYLTWDIRGHVSVRISTQNLGNAVLSGIFFDSMGSSAGSGEINNGGSGNADGVGTVTGGGGTLEFNNRIVGVVDARVLLQDGTGVGEGWTAELLIGPPGGQFVSAATTTFRTTSAAAKGYVNSVSVVAPNIAPGASATIILRAFNGATFDSSTLRGQASPITVSLGGGGVPPSVPANLGGLGGFTVGPAQPNSPPVQTTPPPTKSSFVVRQLPGSYTPGVNLSVTIKATLSLSTVNYSVQDQPPKNWVVGQISDSGAYDANTGRVKWGPYFESNLRTLTYEITPPVGETGDKSFGGIVTADGVSSTIAGTSVISVAQKIGVAQLHPADNNPSDGRMTPEEMTAYGLAWKKNQSWPIAPNPIPDDYVTRAGWLWKNGETYTIDPAMAAPPLWWVNTPGKIGLQSNVPPLQQQSGGISVGTPPPVFVPGESLSVGISVLPSPGVSAYAVRERMPAGWRVTYMSDDGTFDQQSGILKWGPFFDNQVRQLSYLVTSPEDSPDTILFDGAASFDGVSIKTTGLRQSRATSRLVGFTQLLDGRLQLRVNGRQGVKWAVQASSNLVDWTLLSTSATADGALQFSDPVSGKREARFYRAVEQ